MNRKKTRKTHFIKKKGHLKRQEITVIINQDKDKSQET